MGVGGGERRPRASPQGPDLAQLHHLRLAPPRACVCALVSPCPCERADPGPRGSAAGQLPAGCRGEAGSASTAPPLGRGAGPLRRRRLGQAARRRRSAARLAGAPAAGCGRRRHSRRRSICRRRAPSRPASLPACLRPSLLRSLPSRSAPAAAEQPALGGKGAAGCAPAEAPPPAPGGAEAGPGRVPRPRSARGRGLNAEGRVPVVPHPTSPSRPRGLWVAGERGCQAAGRGRRCGGAPRAGRRGAGGEQPLGSDSGSLRLGLGY